MDPGSSSSAVEPSEAPRLLRPLRTFVVVSDALATVRLEPGRPFFGLYSAKEDWNSCMCWVILLAIQKYSLLSLRSPGFQFSPRPSAVSSSPARLLISVRTVSRTSAPVISALLISTATSASTEAGTTPAYRALSDASMSVPTLCAMSRSTEERDFQDCMISCASCASNLVEPISGMLLTPRMFAPLRMLV